MRIKTKWKKTPKNRRQQLHERWEGVIEMRTPYNPGTVWKQERYCLLKLYR